MPQWQYNRILIGEGFELIFQFLTENSTILLIFVRGKEVSLSRDWRSRRSINLIIDQLVSRFMLDYRLGYVLRSITQSRIVIRLVFILHNSIMNNFIKLCFEDFFK